LLAILWILAKYWE